MPRGRGRGTLCGRGLFANSIHADNRCTSCHSDIKEAEHATPLKKVDCADSSVSPSYISAPCVSCHAAERIVTKYRLPEFAVETYMNSFHGLSMRLGSVTATNCLYLFESVVHA